MNEGKEGRPFLYSDELIIRISFIRFMFSDKLIPTEALARRLFGGSPDHTTISRRLYRLNIKWKVDDKHRKGRFLDIDASGMSICRTGSYRHSKYGGMPKFYKLHALIDTESKEILDLRVTKDSCGDNRKFLPIIRESASRGDVVYADGAYDSKENFDYLEKEGILPGIKIRKNFSTNCRGSEAGWKAAMEQFGVKTKRLGGEMHFLPVDETVLHKDKRDYFQKRWKERVGYGRGWLVEAFFYAFKRRFGEHVCSRRWRSVHNEIKRKTILYNELLRA